MSSKIKLGGHYINCEICEKKFSVLAFTLYKSETICYDCLCEILNRRIIATTKRANKMNETENKKTNKEGELSTRVKKIFAFFSHASAQETIAGSTFVGYRTGHLSQGDYNAAIEKIRSKQS